jgi:hypothetical protein
MDDSLVMCAAMGADAGAAYSWLFEHHQASVFLEAYQNSSSYATMTMVSMMLICISLIPQIRLAIPDS